MPPTVIRGNPSPGWHYPEIGFGRFHSWQIRGCQTGSRLWDYVIEHWRRFRYGRRDSYKCHYAGTWTNVTLGSGWTAPIQAQFRVEVNGAVSTVYFRGMVQAAYSALGTTAFTVPSGAFRIDDASSVVGGAPEHRDGERW